METTVEKLEAMFLKSEADLEYIEKRLKLDFINNTAENGRPTEVYFLPPPTPTPPDLIDESADEVEEDEGRGSFEENPAVILESLRAIKAKHTTLCSQAKELAAAQKESMDTIRNNLSSVMKLIQHFQQTTDLEVQPPTESVQESAKILGSTDFIKTTTEVPSAVAASGQQQPLSESATIMSSTLP